MMNLSELDNNDRRIINILKEDPRISYRKLASRAEMSPLTVRKKLRRLKDRGIITGFGVNLDDKQLGLSKVFVAVTVQTYYIKDEGGYLLTSNKTLKKKYKTKSNFIVFKNNEKKPNPMEFVQDAILFTNGIYRNEKYIEITGIYGISGPFDFLIKLIGTKFEDISEFVIEHLTIIPGIKKTETMGVSLSPKDTSDFPIPL